MAGESTLNLPREIMRDFYMDTLDNIKGGLQQNKYARFFSDLYAFGLDGGALDGKIANEIIYRESGDRIEVLGFRKYDPDAGEPPLSDVNDITFDGDRIRGYKDGTLIQRQLRDLYDDNFGMLGAEQILTKGKIDRMGEETEMREEFIKNAIRYYSKKGNPIGNDIYVAEVPHRGNLWQRCDKGLVLYYAEGALMYHAMDWLSRKFRKLMANTAGILMPKFLRRYMVEEKAGLNVEQRLRRQYIRFTDNRNKRWDVNKEVVIRY